MAVLQHLISDRPSTEKKTGSWRTMMPIQANKTSPCTLDCPVEGKIPKWIDFLNAGEYYAAWEVLVNENPFPAITGRVCMGFCERHCNREKLDEPIAVKKLERYLGDIAIGNSWRYPFEKAHKESLKKVAIVGGGTAGLACAYFLLRKGYQPTIFEAEEAIGGLLRYGIPEYRLPNKVLEAELERLMDLGLVVTTGAKIDKDALIALGNEYEAVFLACGAHYGRWMEIVTENTDKVWDGIKLLHAINSGEQIQLGERVAIIGGGNTAIDVARSARRLGAKKALMIVRRTSVGEEIEEAQEEGVEISNQTVVTSATLEGGSIKLNCLRVRWEGKQQISIPGSEFIEKVDSLVLALGQNIDQSILPEEAIVKDGLLVVDKHMRTNVPGLFAGGDLCSNDRTVTHAIQAGKMAAINIDAYLTGNNFSNQDVKHAEPVEYEDINIDYFSKESRVKVENISVNERLESFTEANGSLEKNQAEEEADRCFNCGYCINCDNCVVFCPEIAIAQLNKEYTVNYDFCKGCGLCVTECPRGVNKLKEEGHEATING